MTTRQAILAELRIWTDGAMTVYAISAILVLMLVILTGCSPTPVSDNDQTPEGVTEKMNSDAADCRKQTRTMAGVNPGAWHDRAYSDCMAGRGYKSDAGQTK
jgi:hypothetical protein